MTRDNSLFDEIYPTTRPEQANQILTEAEGPGSGFLDNGSPFGVYPRLNLYATAARAAVFTSSA